MRGLMVGMLVLVGLTWPALAQSTYVQGYVKSNGTYVQPHYRSAPDSTTSNNWTTRGNSNPYTGSYGTRSPDLSPNPGGGWGRY